MLGSAGWAFIPNFAIGGFFHYNSTSIAMDQRGSMSSVVGDSSAHVLLYGFEGRGIIGSGPMIGWASLGLSFGSGSMTQRSNSPAFVGPSASQEGSGEVTFKPMIVLAFGAELELTRGLGLGPQMRWYVTNVDTACENTTTTFPADPTFGQQSVTQSSSRCADRVSDATVPDIIFLGVGLTYRIGT